MFNRYDIIILFNFLFLFSGCESRETQLVKAGNTIVHKIDSFQNNNNHLPDSLEEIGIFEKDESGPFYYQKTDSTHYMLSFGMSLGESKIFYSDSKKWEDFFRTMKN